MAGIKFHFLDIAYLETQDHFICVSHCRNYLYTRCKILPLFLYKQLLILSYIKLMNDGGHENTTLTQIFVLFHSPKMCFKLKKSNF